MKKIYLFLSLLFISLTFLNAQVELAPSIGIGDLPSDGDPVCDIPLYLNNFDASGFQAGELIPEFNLFDLDGNELIMSEMLDQGNPVLLIAGNYTCPVFRNKISVINELVDQHSDQLEVIIIYGVEAHPINDISPYFGYENPGSANTAQGILYEQPTTYGERKALISEMLIAMDIDAPIYIDGPCNEWWANFGPAPNNAYLIDTDGIILSKHPWFDKHPEDIFCDLETYLDIPADCNQSGGGGAFTFELTSAAQMEGPTEQTIYVTGLLTNQSDDGVEIEIVRIEEDLPAGWESSLCTDVCYPSSVTEALVYLEAGETLIYTNYFYTDNEPDFGKVKIGFRNTADLSNQFQQWMSAMTYSTTGINTQNQEGSPIIIYPNPAKAQEKIEVILPKGLSLSHFELYQSNGVKRYESNVLPTQPLAPGVYWYRCHLSNGSTQTGRLLVY